jgi:hypothetical protein
MLAFHRHAATIGKTNVHTTATRRLFTGFLLGYWLTCAHTRSAKDTLAFTGRLGAGFGIVLIGKLST